MTLALDIRHRLGDFRLDARFETGGGLVALFGRSGAGKTSLVNIIAGLIRPDEGRVRIDDAVLVDTSRGVFVPRHKRRIGYVFQEGRLFPHLTVRQNLLFGHWFAARSAQRESPARIVELLGIDHLLDRRPNFLSGGEKQRVAIGRALLAGPQLLLMDEPLASLDEARKTEILPYIERLRDEIKIPIIYVSHSVAEVTLLATTVVVLAGGRVSTVGPTADVMSRLDLIPLTGRLEAGAILEAEIGNHDADSGLTTLTSKIGPLKVPRLEGLVGARIRVRIRARDVILAIHRPEGLSAQNIISAKIDEIASADGPIVDLRLNANGEMLLARVTQQAVKSLQLEAGKPVYAVIKSIAFDKKSLGRLPRADGPDDDHDLI